MSAYLTKFNLILLISLITVISSSAIVTTARQQGEISILPSDPYRYVGNAGPGATAIPDTVTDQPFTRMYRITVNGATRTLNDARIDWKTSQTINAGDNLEISFQIRKVSPADGRNIRAALSFENAKNPAEQFLDTIIPVNNETWQPYKFLFKVEVNYPAGEARIVLRFGHGPQAFDIGGIRAVNLGPDPELPTFGTPIITNDIFGGYGSYFDGQVGGTLNIVQTTGQDFTSAFHISTFGTSDQIYRSGMTYNTTQAVSEGDLALLTFYARKLNPLDDDPIKAQVVFERNGGNYEKSLILNFPNDSDTWKLYQIPFRIKTSFQAGEAHLIFHFGYGPQTFELAGIKVVNFGQQITPQQLQTAFYYPGRKDENALWRKAANDRIDQHRKAGITINIRDRNGDPIPDAEVYIRQLSHKFRFGTAVTAQLIAGSGESESERAIYRSRVSSHFNSVVLENDLKWPFWEDWAPWNRQATLDAMNWLQQKRLPLRGHNLIWPDFDQMPVNTKGLSAIDLRKRIDQHFADILSTDHAGGKCYQWDVINEPFTNFEVQGRIPDTGGTTPSSGILGNSEMVHWFKLARELDPKTKLFLNDYDIIAGGGFENRHESYLFSLTEWLINSGAPVDGVGFQGHFSKFTTLKNIQRAVEMYSTLPVHLAVTEFDISTLDENLQADYLTDVMTMIFSQPGFDDFLLWGFWEKAHWIPQGAMYRSDWSSKPNGLAFLDLVYRQWWTDDYMKTDRSGRCEIRGFKGEYEIIAIHHRVSGRVETRIDDSSEITLTLDTVAPRAPISRSHPRIIRNP